MAVFGTSKIPEIDFTENLSGGISEISTVCNVHTYCCFLDWNKDCMKCYQTIASMDICQIKTDKAACEVQTNIGSLKHSKLIDHPKGE